MKPRTFDEEVYRRWEPINRGPWRFAYDDQDDGPHVERVMTMLTDEPQRDKRIYVLIGNEPVASCLDRVNRVIAWGGEPYCQPVMKLNAADKRPWVRYDWTERMLKRRAAMGQPPRVEILQLGGIPRRGQDAAGGRRPAITDPLKEGTDGCDTQYH